VIVNILRAALKSSRWPPGQRWAPVAPGDIVRCSQLSDATRHQRQLQGDGRQRAQEDERPERQVVRVARCSTSSTPPYNPARANAAKVPESSACQLIQPSAAPVLVASLASFLN
jgi:hypothetical protein